VVSMRVQKDSSSLPQSTMIKDSHVDGAIFFKTKFEGTSNKIYGMKKMKRAML
jgi:hypothetical protein